MKRFVSALLSAVLCLSLCAPAFAAEEQAKVSTQKEYVETMAALTAAREHIDAVRAMIIGDAPKTEEEFTAKLRQARAHIEAVQAMPDLTFAGTEELAKKIRDCAGLVLLENIDPYLKAVENFDLEKSWEKFVDETIPPKEKKNIKYDTNFLGMEMHCVNGENSLKKLEEAEDRTPAADPAEFVDAKDIQYWDAVATLTKLGVVSGKDDGSFDPAGNVTRAEAAKLIAVLMNGGSEPNVEAKVAPTFSDTKGHWAEPYIEYCADMHIVNGWDGRFDPDGSVSVVQFCKMALTALGCDSTAYGLTGSIWASMTKSQAKMAGLTQSLPNEGMDGTGADQPASREVAAQILYNALLANPIVAAPDGLNADGTVVWKYSPVENDTLLRQRFDMDKLPNLPPQPTV